MKDFEKSKFFICANCHKPKQTVLSSIYLYRPYIQIKYHILTKEYCLMKRIYYQSATLYNRIEKLALHNIKPLIYTPPFLV